MRRQRREDIPIGCWLVQSFQQFDRSLVQVLELKRRREHDDAESRRVKFLIHADPFLFKKPVEATFSSSILNIVGLRNPSHHLFLTNETGLVSSHEYLVSIDSGHKP